MELLTVVAIIGVLATLLTSALATAQRKARKTACISNLRQIALAYNLYTVDQRKRPPSFAALAEEKLVTARVLLCPEDRQFMNWAGMIQDLQFANSTVTVGAGRELNAPPEIPHSYFKSFQLPDELWERVEKSPLGGIAACQLHGIGRQEKETLPSLAAYNGLILRALKDGSVLARQVFWNNGSKAAAPGAGPSAPAGADFSGNTPSELSLFIDEAEQ